MKRASILFAGLCFVALSFVAHADEERTIEIKKSEVHTINVTAPQYVVVISNDGKRCWIPKSLADHFGGMLAVANTLSKNNPETEVDLTCIGGAPTVPGVENKPTTVEANKIGFSLH